MEFLPTGDVVSELRTAREFAEKNVAEGRRMAARLLDSNNALESSGR
jgi:hypothetical protein